MSRRSDRLLPIHPNNLNKVIRGEWESISQWLYDVLSSGDVLCEISPVFSTIQRFIEVFGMRLSKTHRVALIRLVVAYICCPNIDTQVSNNAMDLLKKLMSKPYSLPSSAMSIDWKMFYDICTWAEVKMETLYQVVKWPKSRIEKLYQCIALCSKFFPKKSIEEIWFKFRHSICSDLITGSPCTLLPKLLIYTPFYPKYFDEISRVWLPDIFDIWYTQPICRSHHEIIDVLCKVSHIGRGRIDWEPHMERIFTAVFRGITLRNTPLSSRELMSSDQIQVYAELIMNTIGPDRPQCQSTVIYRLEELLKSLESFYHPSSNQIDSAKLLAVFMWKFLRCLISRLRDELFPPVEALDLGYPPPEFYLSVEQIDQIVNLFTPICLNHLLYSKSITIVNITVEIIPMLCKLRPSLVLPNLLNDLEYGLTRPEMPLRFTRPLYALIWSVQSLIYVKFPLYPRGSFSAYLVGEGDPDSGAGGDLDDSGLDDNDVVEEMENGDVGGGKDDSGDESVEEEEDLLSSDADDESAEKVKRNKSPENRNPVRDYDRHEVKKRLFQKASYKPAYEHVSPSVRHGHLKAFTYLAGRAELNRVLQILLHGLDMNFPDRFNYSISCLSRIFLSTPILNFSDDHISNSMNPITQKIISESTDLQDTVYTIYERILSYLSTLNENMYTDVQTVANSQMNTTIYRPDTKPMGNSRSPIDIRYMTGLTGLCISLAISSASNPQFRCRLVKQLTSTIFMYQWQPDTARLLGYQAYWLAIDSSCTASPGGDCSTNKDTVSTSLYAVKLIWPKFMAIVKEIERDNSFIHHYRPEPRLLALLYILPGYICALPAESLVDPEIYAAFIQPLIIILGKLLYLSTGCCVKPQWKELFPDGVDDAIGFNNNDNDGDKGTMTNACPALAEACGSFLGMLLHRLTCYSIDFRRFNLLGNSVGVKDDEGDTDNNNNNDDATMLNSRHRHHDEAYAQSSWWTPFIHLKSIVNYCYNNKGSNNKRRQHSFWFIPTLMTKSLGQQLIKAFLYPIMQELDRTCDRLKILLQNHCNNLDETNAAITTAVKQNNCGKSYAEQQNEFTTLTIWMNHITNGLADALAPRKQEIPTTATTATATTPTTTTVIGNDIVPWHGLKSLMNSLNDACHILPSEDLKSSVSDWDITYFYMNNDQQQQQQQQENVNEVSMELRDSMLKLGLQLLDVISKLIEQADDNLMDNNNNSNNNNNENLIGDIHENNDGSMEKLNHYTDTGPKSIWLLIQPVQIVNLLEITHRAALNIPMNEIRPQLLQIVRGPLGLLSPDLGARNCVHPLYQQASRETGGSNNSNSDMIDKLIPSINSLNGVYCTTIAEKHETGEEIQTYSGCSFITYAARIHEHFRVFLIHHLQKQLMLNVKSVDNNNSNSNNPFICRSIACANILLPSPSIRQFAEILTRLAISPRRSDIRQIATSLLNGYLIRKCPSIGSQLLKSMIQRLDNIIPDINASISSSSASLISSASGSSSSSSLSALNTNTHAQQISSLIASSLETKQKLIHFRRISAITLCKRVFCRHHTDREYDELFRLDPCLFVQFCLCIIQQLMNYEKENSIWFNDFHPTVNTIHHEVVNGDDDDDDQIDDNSPYREDNTRQKSKDRHNQQQQQHQRKRQLKQLQTNRDQLEHLITQILRTFKHFPIDVILYFPTKDKLPPNSWLSKIFIEIDYCLNHAFQHNNNNNNGSNSTCNAAIETLNTPNQLINKVIEKRIEALTLYTQKISEYIVKICSNFCKNLQISSKDSLPHDTTDDDLNSVNSCNSSWMFITTLLQILHFPMNEPLSPQWKSSVNCLTEPVLCPPSVKFIHTLFELMKCEQTEVAFTAIRCIAELNYTLVGYYRKPLGKCIYPAEVCKEKSTGEDHHEGESCLPNIIAGPRPDNKFLLFDENAKVLQSNDAYRKHHHIGSLHCGFVYYPPEVYIPDPDCVIPYPVFNDKKKDMATTAATPTTPDDSLTFDSIIISQQSWLSHFTRNDSQNPLRQQCAYLSAYKLSNQYSCETREFWIKLAKNLLYMHRTFLGKSGCSHAIRFLVYTCLLAYGPENMLKHIEYFIKTLLITLPNNSKNSPLDGKAEFIGFYWIRAVLNVLILLSELWSREWRYYFWRWMIPRILCWSEICALKVSVNDLAQSIDEKLHPTLTHVQWVVSFYAGKFAGGRDDDDDDTNDGGDHVVDSTTEKPSSVNNTNNRVSQSSAGGPFHRISFMYAFVIHEAIDELEQDVHCLHPLWDWAIQGLLECCCHSNTNKNNNNNNNPLSQMKSSACQHMKDISDDDSIIIMPSSIGGDDGDDDDIDTCPSCLLNQYLPLQHRRVFYERICYVFTMSMGWIGIPLHEKLISLLQATTQQQQKSSFISSLSPSSTTTTTTVNGSSSLLPCSSEHPQQKSTTICWWYSQACNNALWIRDLAALIATYHTSCIFNIHLHEEKNNLSIITYNPRRHKNNNNNNNNNDNNNKTERSQLLCLTKQPSTNVVQNYELFAKSLFNYSEDNYDKFTGGEFLVKVFIPLLVRDTVNVLRLKGVKLSKSTLKLPVAEPEQINSAILKEIYNKISNTAEIITDDNDILMNNDKNDNSYESCRRAEIIVLSNRLFCLYTCFTSLLTLGFPVYRTKMIQNALNGDTVVDTSDSTTTTTVNNNIHSDSNEHNNNESQLIQSACCTSICQYLMPLIADICSIGNAYDYFSISLNMNIFHDNSSISKTKHHGVEFDDENMDGLNYSVSAYLINLSTMTLSGQGHTSVKQILSTIEQFVQYFLEHPSWRSRAIGILLFRNLVVFNLSAFYNSQNVLITDMTIDKYVNKKIRRILWNCLNDALLEVSQIAMFVMAVFIEVNLIKYDEKWIRQLIKQINQPLPKSINHQLHNGHIVHSNNTPTDNVDAVADDGDSEYRQAVKTRYRSVLALCSFIHGHPHTTPDYLPMIISELSNHIHDPQPIKQVISSTLSAYSRSHQEVWHEQSLKFTPEQLENYKFVISDASYYV
ncbi:unnamed protein product [Trichobilharzia szidati]|nr:unnamed protein product [Trichobilharzia szidati]